MIGPTAVAMLIQITWLVCQFLSQSGQPKTGSPQGFCLKQHSLTLVVVWLHPVVCANLHDHCIPLGRALLLKLLADF